MAWGQIASGLLTAGASALGSKLFGGKSKGFELPSMNAGGLSGTGGNLTASAERKGLVSSLASTFGPQADIFQGLRESVTPGMSALRRARLAEVEGARSRAIGNLRDNLARRRVLGSSFGEDAILRGEAEFAKEKDRVQAETFLQELEATQQLTQLEFETRRGEFQTALDELNLEAGIGAQLTANATQVLSANARLKAQLDAQAASGMGKFFGQTFQPAFDKIGSTINNFFSSRAPVFSGVGAYPM